jgi:hypothetical protein
MTNYYFSCVVCFFPIGRDPFPRVVTMLVPSPPPTPITPIFAITPVTFVSTVFCETVSPGSCDVVSECVVDVY